MLISELKKKKDEELKAKYGWRTPLVFLWWKVEDLYYETILYDLVWWITDGKPQWDDAELCSRRLCCKCGNKPF